MAHTIQYTPPPTIRDFIKDYRPAELFYDWIVGPVGSGFAILRTYDGEDEESAILGAPESTFTPYRRLLIDSFWISGRTSRSTISIAGRLPRNSCGS